MRTILAGLLIIGLNACSDDGWPLGEMVIINNDGASYITSIFISTDCTDSWGNADSTGLAIAPGGATGKYELETRTYDILACFDADLGDDFNPLSCGQVLDVEVHDIGTAEVYIADGGIPAAPANCL